MLVQSGKHFLEAAPPHGQDAPRAHASFSLRRLPGSPGKDPNTIDRQVPLRVTAEPSYTQCAWIQGPRACLTARPVDEEPACALPAHGRLLAATPRAEQTPRAERVQHDQYLQVYLNLPFTKSSNKPL